MSAENVELIRRGYDHYAQTGDIYEPAMHPNAEWHTAADLPDSDAYRGIDAIRAFIKTWPSAFEEFGAEIGDIADKGDYVIVSMILCGRVRGTGEQVEMPETHVWKFRDGKATEVREYRTLDAALEALWRLTG